MKVRGWLPLPRRGLAVSAFSSASPWPRLKSPDRKIGGFFSSPPPQRTAGSASGPHAPRPSLRSGTQDTPAAPVPSLVPRSELQRNAALLRGRSFLAQPRRGCPLRFLATPGASCGGAPAPPPPPAGRAARSRPLRASPRLRRSAPPVPSLRCGLRGALAAPAAPGPPSAPLRAPAASLWLPLLCSGCPLGLAWAAGSPLPSVSRAACSCPGGQGAFASLRPLWWLRPPGLCRLSAAARPAPAALRLRPCPVASSAIAGSFSPAPPRPAAPAGGSGGPGASWLGGCLFPVSFAPPKVPAAGSGCGFPGLFTFPKLLT